VSGKQFQGLSKAETLPSPSTWGVNVLITISAILTEKMALLTQSEAKLYQNLIITFVSENCDHNIGPSFRRKNWRFAVKPMF
jgi:hypothetical protein